MIFLAIGSAVKFLEHHMQSALAQIRLSLECLRMIYVQIIKMIPDGSWNLMISESEEYSTKSGHARYTQMGLSGNNASRARSRKAESPRPRVQRVVVGCARNHHTTLAHNHKRRVLRSCFA